MDQLTDADMIEMVGEQLEKEQLLHINKMRILAIKDKFEDPALTANPNRKMDVEILRYQGTINDDLLKKYYRLMFTLVHNQDTTVYLDLLVAIVKRYLQFPKADWYLIRYFKAIDYEFTLRELWYVKDFIDDLFITPDNREADYEDTIAGLPKIVRLLEEKFVDIMPFSKTPDYIRDEAISIKQLPTLSQLVSDNNIKIDDNVSRQGMMQFMSNMLRETLADQKDLPLVLSRFESMKLEDLRRLYLSAVVPGQYIPLIKDLQKDEQLFRALGPVNVYNDNVVDTVENAHLNFEYGGARMFTDLLSEYDTFDDEMQQEWFTGSCEQCYHRIAKYQYAVRRPLILGGWRGCFCDFDCVRAWLEYYFDNNDTSEADEALTYALVAQYEKAIARIGISSLVTL